MKTDISGSTPLGERLDPEDLRAVLGSYFAALAREIQRENDTLEQRYGVRLACRAGINTGDVIVGPVTDDVHSSFTVIGEAVNVAERMDARRLLANMRLAGAHRVIVHGRDQSATSPNGPWCGRRERQRTPESRDCHGRGSVGLDSARRAA